MDYDSIDNVRLNKDSTAVVILDQTRLPNESIYIELREPGELREAITALRVRGAPAIGIFAAYALYVAAQQTAAARQTGTTTQPAARQTAAAQQSGITPQPAAQEAAAAQQPAARQSGVTLRLDADSHASFRDEVKRLAAYLDSARPTAVNLSKQLRRMENLVDKHADAPIPLVLDAMREEAIAIQREDADMCRAISEHGLELILEGYGIMTHCNAGPLATSLYGTALGPILMAHERGIALRAFCCETRPLLQGARLTAYELDKAGVDCTLICDNMASIVMKEGKIDAVFVGCDRAARNGDVANKIGTSGAAILAKHYGIPFYVFCPSSTIDPDCPTGDDIVIEQRKPGEIKEMFFEKPVAPDSIKCYNPSFDVTCNRLITGIVTEKGVCRAPYEISLFG